MRAYSETAEAITDPEPEARPGTADPRWQLWRDLRDRTGESSGWEPLVVRRVFDVSADPAGLIADRVEVIFDHRLPRAALFASLERLWPRLTDGGWIRPTRTMEARAAALIRFVCLDNPPDTTWRVLMDGWNKKHRKNRPEWQHKDVRDFQSRFHKAEEQLTGQKRGLEWFYDMASRPEDWSAVTLGELEQMDARGELMGSRVVSRGFGNKLRSKAYGLGLRLGGFAGAANTLQAQGLTPWRFTND